MRAETIDMPDDESIQKDDSQCLFDQVVSTHHDQVPWEARITRPMVAPLPNVNQKLRFVYAHVERRHRGVDHRRYTTIDLVLTRSGRGWRVTGTGRQYEPDASVGDSAIDGIIKDDTHLDECQRQRHQSVKTVSNFEIRDGFLAHHGRAYWIEEHSVSGDSGCLEAEGASLVLAEEQELVERKNILVDGYFVNTMQLFQGRRTLCWVAQSRNCSPVLVHQPMGDCRIDNVSTMSTTTQASPFVHQVIYKTEPDQPMGVVFSQSLSSRGQTIVDMLLPNSILALEAPRLAVSMPVITVNGRLVHSPRQASQLLQDAPVGPVSLVGFDNLAYSEDALQEFTSQLTDRLQTVFLDKGGNVHTRTGITFRKRGDDALFVWHVQSDSIACKAGVQIFSRVWAINETTYFPSSQAAAEMILQATGVVAMLLDPTGSMDEPMRSWSGQASMASHGSARSVSLTTLLARSDTALPQWSADPTQEHKEEAQHNEDRCFDESFGLGEESDAHNLL